MNRLRNFLYSRGPERGIVFVTCKIHRNSVVWTDCGAWCWLFRIQWWILEKSLASHAPGWVLPLLDSLRQKTHHLFIIHLLDLLQVNRIPDSCWAPIQTWKEGYENICCSQEPLEESDLTQAKQDGIYHILPGRRTFLKIPEWQMSHLRGFIAEFYLGLCKAKMTL